MRVWLIILTLSSFLLGLLTGLLYTPPPHDAVVVVPGVSEDGKGVLARIEAETREGRGRIYVSVFPRTGFDLQESVEIATLLASQYAGVPLVKRDVVFTIYSDTPVVEGPSGGAALFVAAYAALTGKEPRQDVSVTGVLHWDGSIGAVGGLVEKLEAVSRGGIHVFLIPQGQRVVEEVVPVEEVYSPLPGVVLTRIRYEVRRVDLVEMGREVGVEVVEVENVEDLLRYFFR